ncbi:hypothetical protein KPG71_00300 [Roseovarius sp. PS-C2]|uniref:hypothetical protein n=1 Tax=Roseovarius sp. PS-C2 TaxID=2820814 RepID=UPI001C0D9607|nr:hypothetical protein [Roseovarius sp. PS-C2]MBU3258443.1 hypothetical protein [Roseovarius sp. PS-C2]
MIPDDPGHVRVFGSDVQQQMQRKAHHLWPLLRNDPRYGYEGRMVGLDGAEPADVPLLAALARLQGASVSHYVPLAQEAELAAHVAGAGLVTDRWDQFMGGAACIETCARVLNDFRLPDGYELHVIETDTPEARFDGLSDTALACGVLPPVTAVLSAQTQRAVCYCLDAPDGGVAACAGAVMRNPVESRHGGASWWGMLATRAADRGQGLSLYLGARAVLHMHEHYGAAEFYTGIRSDNAVSRHVCTKLGVVQSDYMILAVLDPDLFGEGGYTK